MPFTMPETAATRSELLRAYRRALTALVEDATQRPGDVENPDTGELDMSLGDWDGVPVVTRKRLDQAIAAVFDQQVPGTSETTVEVRAPATVLSTVTCQNCDIDQVVSVSIHGELLMSDEGSEIRARAKSKPVPHVCGQLPLAAGSRDEDGDGLEQLGATEAIESLVWGVSRDLEELLGAGQGPSIDEIRAWDRATIDQVDRWASAKRAAQGQHPEGCGAGEDDLGCTCGLIAAIPPLPRALGGEADPEPVFDVTPRCRVCGCTDFAACDPACSWVEVPDGAGDLCSACLPRIEAGERIDAEDEAQAEADRDHELGEREAAYGESEAADDLPAFMRDDLLPDGGTIHLVTTQSIEREDAHHPLYAIVRDGETLDGALRRIEVLDDYSRIIGSQAGQALMDAVRDEGGAFVPFPTTEQVEPASAPEPCVRDKAGCKTHNSVWQLKHPVCRAVEQTGGAS